jgi:cytochrome c-type biogenesis protein CcmH/NrfG
MLDIASTESTRGDAYSALLTHLKLVKLFQQAVERNAGHFLLWLELGQCQQTLGLVGPARISLTQAQQLNPRCDQARLALTRLAETGLGSRFRGFWRRIFSR